MTKLAVITVDYNNHKDTEEFIKSSRKLDTSNLDMLWLVVDNGSDTSVKETVHNFTNVVWKQTGKNLGFSGGFNQGLKYAKEWGADYFLIANNDILFEDANFLKRLLKVLSGNEKAGVVSPKIYFAKGFEYHKDRYLKSDEGNVIWYAGGYFDWDNVMSKHRGIDEVDTGKYDKVEKTDFVTGCCVLVKREVLEKVGYFEEKLFAYYEDNDWMERISKAGFEKWYTGETHIYHKVSRTAGIASEWSDYLITRNRLWFGMKYASERTKFALLREALRLVVSGRKAQREGVLDYVYGNWGWKRAKQNSSTDYPIDLSIVIVNYNTPELTENAIKSIFASPIKCKFEVILVDNGSTEKANVKLPIKYVENASNLGFAKANNQGINYTLGKHVLLLNSDTEVVKGSIDKLYEFAEKNENIGAVSSKLLNSDQSEQSSTFRLPTAIGALKEYWFKQKSAFSIYVPKGDKPVEVEAAAMTSFLITRKALTDIGLLDETYFMYFEDLDYCRRLAKKGLKVFYLPDSKVYHYHGQSGKKIADANNQWRRLNPSSKKYHGLLMHYLIFAIMWPEQRIRRWKESFFGKLQ